MRGNGIFNAKDWGVLLLGNFGAGHAFARLDMCFGNPQEDRLTQLMDRPIRQQWFIMNAG